MHTQLRLPFGPYINEVIILEGAVDCDWTEELSSSKELIIESWLVVSEW